MDNKVEAHGDRSTAVGRDIVNSVVATGDNNVINFRVSAPTRQRARLSRQTWRAWLFERRVEVAAAGLVVIAIAAAAMYWRESSALPPMAGNLNIAVADFASVDARGTPVPSQSATTIARQTAAALQQVMSGAAPGEIGVQIWDPNRPLRVQGSARAERGQAAQGLAQQINAQVIVYGAVSFDGAATTLTPEFYVSDKLLDGAEELAGQYELGSPIVSNGDFERNLGTVADLRDGLLRRTRALAQFMFGLGQFTRRDLAQAERLFSSADSSAWNEHDGKEILYLFLGSTAGVNHDLDKARAYYEHALDIRPGYARALLGLAEVEFQAAGPTQDCDPDRVDAALLHKAADDLAAVSNAPVQPSVSNISEKTAYLLGRVDLCLSQAGLDDRFEAARAELQTVITAYETGKPGLVDFAAEAHAALGLIAFPETGETLPTARAEAYRRALAEYENATRLSQHRERQAEFSTMIGYIHTRLGEPGKAATAYATALDLDPPNRARNEALRTRWEQAAPGG